MKLEESGSHGSEGDNRIPSFIASDVPGTNGMLSRTLSTAMLPMHMSRTQLNKDEDSTDSDEAAGEPILLCPLSAHHHGKVLLNTEVALPIDSVFSLLFQQDQFMVDVYAARKTTDVTSTTWQDQAGEGSTRNVTYNMALSLATLGAKASFVTETQVLQSSQPGQVYVVETDAVNSRIPYADAFSVFNHYCITKKSDLRTHIRVWCSIKYKKQVWGFVKGMLEKNAYGGVEALLGELAAQLSSEANKTSQQSGLRRRRRGAKTTSKARPETREPPNSAPESPSQRCHWLVITILVSMTILAAGNLFLFVKLWRLERQSPDEITPLLDTPAVRHLGKTGSWEVVARILQRQENLHEDQVERWKITLNEANQKLLEVHESLEAMLDGIPQHVESLKVALQNQAVLATDVVKAPDAQDVVRGPLNDGDELGSGDVPG